MKVSNRCIIDPSESEAGDVALIAEATASFSV